MSRKRIAIANTASPRIRPPFPRLKANASRRASRSSVPETIASARPPRRARRTAPFESERRRQIANAIRAAAKTRPEIRRAVSSGGKMEPIVTKSCKAAAG
jgi:hypothetical protein